MGIHTGSSVQFEDFLPLMARKLVSGSFPRRSPPGGYSARVKGLDTQVRALES
jgi:hypothetical protein